MLHALHSLRTRVTYANVAATLALVLALGGSAVAATKIKTKNLAAGAVTTPKIANGAVTAAKIAPGVIPTPVTPVTPAAPKIAIRRTKVTLPGQGDGGFVTAKCLPGEQLTGGAARILDPANALDIGARVISQGPLADNVTWQAHGTNSSPDDRQFEVSAFCLS